MTEPRFLPEGVDDPALEAMLAAGDVEGLSNQVDALMKLPQSLCKMRGDCCKVATFKGSLSFEELKSLAASNDPDAANAREFLALFRPYENEEAVKTDHAVFVERVHAQAQKQGKEGPLTFYRCRFLSEEGRCMIHEDRPTGCRVYPFPHERTVYHPGCGFEKQGTENALKIKVIMDYFEARQRQMQEEITALKELAKEELQDAEGLLEGLIEQVEGELPEEK